MDIKNVNVNDAKDKADKLVNAVASNKEAKDTVNKVIDEVEKKVKVDLPDVDGIKKLLD